MSSSIHDSFSRYFCWNLSLQIHDWLSPILYEHKISIILTPIIRLLDVSIARKVPDAGLKVTKRGDVCTWPQMAIEVGYSEMERELCDDAWNWLYGSSNHVQSVLVVKFEKPVDPNTFGNWKQWTGWLEIHARSSSTRCVSYLIIC